MAKRKRFVDIVAPQVIMEEGSNENLSFGQILQDLNHKQVAYKDGFIKLEILTMYGVGDDDFKDCIIGIVKTEQSKNLPTKVKKDFSETSAIDIDPETEGLGFANIFIYNKFYNFLIYEINKNGCMLNQLKRVIHQIEAENERTFSIDFLAILKEHAIERVNRLEFYSKVILKIYQPSQIRLQDIEDTSFRDNLVARAIENSQTTNTEILTIEQSGIPRKICSATGSISHNYVKHLMSMMRHLLPMHNANNDRFIQQCIVKGYTLDIEDSDSRKQQTINLIADRFNEYFYIPDIRRPSDFQQGDRAEGIMKLYKKVFKELQSMMGGK